MEEKKAVSYNGYGDAVFNNEDDIAYYKKTQNYEIVQAGLLGTYNDKGQYVIAEDICILSSFSPWLINLIAWLYLLKKIPKLSDANMLTYFLDNSLFP